MLPQERAAILRQPEHTTVAIGNRSATLVDHYSFWGRALWSANYESLERNRRHYVMWCPTHQKWAVWRLNHQAVR